MGVLCMKCGNELNGLMPGMIGNLEVGSGWGMNSVILNTMVASIFYIAARRSP